MRAAEPFFYSYIYLEPAHYRETAIAHGHFDEMYGEFVLPYAEVSASADPERVLTEFLRSAYNSGADLAHWDRVNLEREPVTRLPQAEVVLPRKCGRCASSARE